MTIEEHDRDAHGVRPTDLVALVAFDDDVFENHAFTRERLARPDDVPRPLGAAIEHWLGLGRRTWIDVQGRQIDGIATARELNRGTWIIDTLIDASSGDTAAMSALLRQAHDAALEERVTHVLLRTRTDSPALSAALHLGFKRVLVESTWRGGVDSRAGADARNLACRRADPSDEAGRFQLFNRLLPLDAREAMALTLEEWQQTRERRWLHRGGTEWLAFEGDTLVGELQVAGRRADPQFAIVVDGARPEAAAALAVRAREVLRRREPALAMTIAGNATETAYQACGFERLGEYGLLCLRLAHPIRATQRARASLAVPTRG
ncbi:MAG: hypothetical protein U0360_10135 [Dehalococcoidia bacterium]